MGFPYSSRARRRLVPDTDSQAPPVEASGQVPLALDSPMSGASDNSVRNRRSFSATSITSMLFYGLRMAGFSPYVKRAICFAPSSAEYHRTSPFLRLDHSCLVRMPPSCHDGVPSHATWVATLCELLTPPLPYAGRSGLRRHSRDSVPVVTVLHNKEEGLPTDRLAHRVASNNRNQCTNPTYTSAPQNAERHEPHREIHEKVKAVRSLCRVQPPSLTPIRRRTHTLTLTLTKETGNTRNPSRDRERDINTKQK